MERYVHPFGKCRVRKALLPPKGWYGLRPAYDYAAVKLKRNFADCPRDSH